MWICLWNFGVPVSKTGYIIPVITSTYEKVPESCATVKLFSPRTIRCRRRQTFACEYLKYLKHWLTSWAFTAQIWFTAGIPETDLQWIMESWKLLKVCKLLLVGSGCINHERLTLTYRLFRMLNSFFWQFTCN
jgi:hypothetical protein